MIAPLSVRRFLAIVLLTVATAAPTGSFGSAAAAPDFIQRLGDVPLMPGLKIVENAGVEFDAPGGRIVEVAAAGAVPQAAVLRFYQASLPRLGWSGGGRVFVRDGEKLRLDLSGAGGRTEIRFFLSPTH